MQPSRADVKVGFACNNRCVFCAQGEKRRACGAVSYAELVRRLAAVRPETGSLVLTGGEPTLHRDLPRLVAAAKKLGFHPIQIQTNGRMLRYPEAVEKLARAGATELSPSLHGSTAAVHDALTRAPGSYEDTVAGIRNAVASGLPVVTNSVVVRDNLGDLPALVRLLASLGVPTAQLAFVHPVGTAAELFAEVVPRLPEVVAPIAAARAAAREAGMRLVTEAVPLCFLRGMEDLAVEDAIPETTVVDLDGAAFDYSSWRQGDGKAHGPPCEGCGARARCEGPWREYPAAFGWDEFVPLPPGATGQRAADATAVEAVGATALEVA
ncbi:MAG: radical SAM protein [Polyangiaceae bacterium]|nr:radical SAM protein [Polyangiaceae bacterium]